MYPSEVHHWKSKGAGGSDHPYNLLPLCREHHDEVHRIGRKSFWEKYKEKIKYARRILMLPALEVGEL
jgi:hypothetical protein